MSISNTMTHLIEFSFQSSISKDIRQQSNFKKKFLWFLGILSISAFNITTYSQLAFYLSEIKTEYQWILTLTAPIVREMSLRIALKACSKATEGSMQDKLTVYHYFDTAYAFFVSLMLGNIATTESQLCLIGIDFLMIMYNGLKIVKKSRAGANGKQSILL